MNNITILILAFLFTGNLFSQNSIEIDRIEKGKKSIVRILIDGNPSGTGFFINNRADLATCWHVVAPAIMVNADGGITIKKIEIELHNEDRIEVGINKYYIGKGYQDASIYDYCLLQPLRKVDVDFGFYRLGDFEKIQEGEAIYTAGYPLGIEQLFFSNGILSSKWVDTHDIGSNSQSRKIS